MTIANHLFQHLGINDEKQRNGATEPVCVLCK